MEAQPQNSLQHAASAYLRSARHQPVAWFAWGPEPFAKAAAEGKPVLLDIGAVWCHWCHVMDRESYEDPTLAALLNDLYICVKVDRDERPDVDTRYQAAVQAISGQGGWPLTAFLTPQGKPFFGGTYFPPEDRYGRPGFERVLKTMAAAFYERPDEVAETAASIMAAIEHAEVITGGDGALSEDLVSKLTAAALSQFDERNGGFGGQPKFPHSGALDLLIDAAGRNSTQSQSARTAAAFTLEKMAAGGVYDQLAGGFHRYSVDEKWIVPHFEKMAYDNSELLRNYVHAFQAFADPAFAAVALDIMRWIDSTLSDRESGGFYASQDADVSLDDDGDYFTWTLTEVRAALTPEEFDTASAYFNLRDVGDMHHNPQKNVLHRRHGTPPLTPAVIAAMKQTLYASRLQRPTPYIDRTIYTGWNAMCASAYIAAGRVLRTPRATDFALLSLSRALAETWDGQTLRHVVAYGEATAQADPVPGVLEDYAFMATACLDAWEATGDIRWYRSADEIAAALCAKFADTTDAGFFDTEPDADALGALAAHRKPMQDAPVPAGNPVAANVLLRLTALGASADYERLALATLHSFAGVAEHFGLHAATFGLATLRAVHGTEQVCIVGADESADELERAALTGYVANRSVIRLRSLHHLPPALEMLRDVPGEGSFALVCRGRVCEAPARSVAEFTRLLAD